MSKKIKGFTGFTSALIVLLFSSAVVYSQGGAAQNERIDTEQVSVFWIAPDTFGKATDTIGIGFELKPKWHVYWKNPGDSGTAPKITLKSSEAAFGEFLWPAPQSIRLGHLVNFGYDGPVAGIPFFVTPQKELKSVNMTADLEWLVCRDEECVPGRGEISLSRKISDEPVWNSTSKEHIDRLLKAVPRASDPKNNHEPKFKYWEAQPNGAFDLVTKAQTDSFKGLELFPANGDWLKPKYEQLTNGSELRFRFSALPGIASPLSAGLVATWKDANGDSQAVEWLDVPVQKSAPASTVGTPSSEAFSFAVLILLALLGGALLNLMPCVFPVLSIKILSLLKQHPGRKERYSQAFLYLAGVVISFALLGGAVLLLQALGSSVGWGFQLQSPWVVITLIVFFFLMALSFLGVFGFGTNIMNLAGKSANTGSFFSGFLAVFVAAPCTGPFMGTALGATITLSAVESMLLFISLGLGLALPYVLLSLNSRALKLLPRPGPWMIHFKEFMAFPLFATVLWLFWVLASQLGGDAWLYGSIVLLGLTLALWFAQKLTNNYIGKGIAGLIVLATLFFGGTGINNLVRNPTFLPAQSKWEPFTASTDEEIKQFRKEGNSVFVDYTATWCLTCQWNKKAVLETEPAMDLFQRHKTRLIQADWSKTDPAVTKSLAQFGRNSIPLYVFYPAKGEPKILPQFLTLSALKQMYVD